ncbi:hypothetical protein BSKO_02517 [Bryopsis sp. KO-2023]|nr:hypothetical protein BSKO_02517 [Bryopsis sp. KO-2023]
MKSATMICVLLFAGVCLANASYHGPGDGEMHIGDLRIPIKGTSKSPSTGSVFKVDNGGGYVIKLTVQYFDIALSKIVKWQSDGKSLGFSASYTFPSTAAGIDCWTNIVMAGFPEILYEHYDSAADMCNTCTAYKVWGTIFSPQYTTTC